MRDLKATGQSTTRAPAVAPLREKLLHRHALEKEKMTTHRCLEAVQTGALVESTACHTGALAVASASASASAAAGTCSRLERSEMLKSFLCSALCTQVKGRTQHARDIIHMTAGTEL